VREHEDDPPRRGPLRPGDSPLPANINLLVPIGSILGWSAAPPWQADSASSTPRNQSHRRSSLPTSKNPLVHDDHQRRRHRHSPRLRPRHYTPSRKLKHLLRARTATCDAPGCNAEAVHCDLDHTLPWPDGIPAQLTVSSFIAFVTKMLCCVWRDAMHKWVLLVVGGAVSDC
jgi:hypothetical protein